MVPNAEVNIDRTQNLLENSDTFTPFSTSQARTPLEVASTPSRSILHIEPSANHQDPGDITFQEGAGDLFAQLTWPDSEALLQSILNSNLSSWPQTFETLPSGYLVSDHPQARPEQDSPWLVSNANHDSSNGTNAIKNISQIISDLTTNLTSEVESTALSTIFLEACLHVFFEQFTASFPVCHRPTFIFRDWTHPLLLNAISLGSLFIGQDVNIAKGEVLWTLAHTAVATSWHSLIQHKGPYDSCHGVQIITAALLGQTYAMLSGTKKLRTTAQIFHSLGFYWAQQCDMFSKSFGFDTREVSSITSEERRIELWRLWAAEEVQLRALLGHYILDGILTYLTGAPTCQRHASNPFPLPGSDRLFNAANVDEWARLFQEGPRNQIKFRQVFLDLFESPIDALDSITPLSAFSVEVVMAGIQSFVTDSNIAGGHVVGSPPQTAIRGALHALYTFIITPTHFSDGERIQLLLRWHTICIDAAVNFNNLCRCICSQFDTEQAVFGKVKSREDFVDLKKWTRTPGARRALLHAVAIWDCSKELPVGQAYTIQIPICLFAAATIYAAFVLGGTSSTQLPHVHRWKPLLIEALDEIPQVRTREDVQLFNYIASFSNTDRMHGRNLLYDVNAFMLLLKQIRRPWGICADFESILQQWLSRCGI